MNEYIGILDMGFEGIQILDTLNKKLKYENLVYINDYKKAPYEGLKVEAIEENVKANVDNLLKLGIKALIVISDTICEYCTDYLNKLNILVINIVDTLIDYVNNKYELKNIILLAKNDILEANLYQKNFKYNHLYSLPCDELNKCIETKEIKTARSFNSCKDTFKSILKKDVDVIVPSSPYLVLLKTEIKEYVGSKDIIDIGEVIGEMLQKILEELKIANTKKNGKIYLYTTEDKKEYLKNALWFKNKCKTIYNKEESVSEN